MVALLAILFVQSISQRLKDKIIWVPFAALLGAVLAGFSTTGPEFMFYESYKIDGLSQFFKTIIFLGLAVCAGNALRVNSLGPANRADYFFFMFMSAFGLLLLASTVELFTIYISLELASFCLYIMLPFRNKDPRAVEASVKYILFGAVATAVGLYGISYILAGMHTTYVNELLTMDWSFAEQPMALIGLALFLMAFAYKLALFPLHFWAPDVMQGASNETATFAATLPKLGAIVILVRLMGFDPGIELKVFLGVFAALSMTIGNLAALNQTDVKRLLGYSSVSHAGFVIVGLVAGGAYGLAAASYYALVYMVMNLTIFWVITRISQEGKNVYLDDLRGLYSRSPVLALVLAVSAFALVGLPPTAGFIGKVFLFGAAWDAGFFWLVIIGVINSALAIFYYLNLVRYAYTMEPEVPSKISLTPAGAIIAVILALGVIYLGVLPQDIFDFLMQSSTMFLSF